MTTYNVHYTDIATDPIVIEEAGKDTSTDITTFGRVKLEYGQDLNENILHLLENFACPETAGSTINTATPDITANGGSITNPREGQIWYNSTRKALYFWTGSKWTAVGNRGNYNANWGQISDGSQIPRPVNAYTGETYDYSQCIWAVSPANIPTAFTFMVCTTDNDAVVNMKYRAYGENSLTSGTANFLIISIAGNVNAGNLNVVPLTPAISQTPTATPTPSVSTTPSVTPPVSPTRTPAASPTPTPAISASPSSTPAPSPTRTPAPSNTPAPSITPTPSPFASICDTCNAMGANCCVSVSSFLPDGKLAGKIKVGDFMKLADEVTLEPFEDQVSYSEPSMQDSLRIITKRGAILDCSKTAPIPTKKGVILSPEVMGEFVAVNIDGESSWDEVVDLKELGVIEVQHITVNNKSFWAGKNEGSYILHHNIKCCYCNDNNCTWTQPNCCLCL